MRVRKAPEAGPVVHGQVVAGNIPPCACLILRRRCSKKTKAEGEKKAQIIEKYTAEQRQQAKPTHAGEDVGVRMRLPLYDISALLRARRLKWVGDTLRIDVPSLAKEVLVAKCTQFINSGMRVSGSAIMDLPVCESVKELMELVSNKSEWSKLVHSIHPPNSQKRAYQRKHARCTIDMDAEI